jgi:hypothetical protein
MLVAVVAAVFCAARVFAAIAVIAAAAVSTAAHDVVYAIPPFIVHDPRLCAVCVQGRGAAAFAVGRCDAHTVGRVALRRRCGAQLFTAAQCGRDSAEAPLPGSPSSPQPAILGYFL